MPFTKFGYPGTCDCPGRPRNLQAILPLGNLLCWVRFPSPTPAWAVCVHSSGWLSGAQHPTWLITQSAGAQAQMPRNWEGCVTALPHWQGVHLATQCNRLSMRSIRNDKHRHLSYQVNGLVMSNPLDCPDIDVSWAPVKKLFTAVWTLLKRLVPLLYVLGEPL